MFDSKFFLSAATFEAYKESDVANPVTRFLRFAQAAHALLRLFEVTPGLKTIRLIAYPQSEIAKEEAEFCVRIRHHIKTTLVFDTAAQDDPDFGFSNLPYAEIGFGSFVIHQGHPLVRKHLGLVASEQDAMTLDKEYHSLVLDLARELDLAFGTCPVLHDFGHQEIDSES